MWKEPVAHGPVRYMVCWEITAAFPGVRGSARRWRMRPSADVAIPLPGTPSNGIRGQLRLLSPKLWASQVSQKHQHNLF